MAYYKIKHGGRDENGELQGTTDEGEAVWDLSDPVGQSVFLDRMRSMADQGFGVKVEDPGGR